MATNPNLGGLELYNVVDDIAHEFEIDLTTVVIENHRLTLDGIAKAEEAAIAEIEEDLADEAWEVSSSEVSHRQRFYESLQSAANQLAVVGLVIRLDHWIRNLMKKHKIQIVKNQPRGDAPTLIKMLDALNRAVKDPSPVNIDFFDALVTARDSVIHGDSQAQWEDSRDQSPRTVAPQYKSGGRLEVTEDQLRDAIAKAIEQVKWYDQQFQNNFRK